VTAEGLSVWSTREGKVLWTQGTDAHTGAAATPCGPGGTIPIVFCVANTRGIVQCAAFTAVRGSSGQWRRVAIKRSDSHVKHGDHICPGKLVQVVFPFNRCGLKRLRDNRILVRRNFLFFFF
jgi:hypothetical protein